MKRKYIAIANGLLILLTCLSCSILRQYVYVYPEAPIIPVVVAPTLVTQTASEVGCLSSSVLSIIQGNIKSLRLYAEKMCVSIEIYNEWAKRQNILNGYIEEVK